MEAPRATDINPCSFAHAHASIHTIRQAHTRTRLNETCVQPFVRWLGASHTLLGLVAASCRALSSPRCVGVVACILCSVYFAIWETKLLFVMLESSSRLAARSKAVLMASSACLEAWCSTIIEVSCSSLIPTTIECKYSRVMMMARSCPSSARKVANRASSTIHLASRSITIMIASSSLNTPIVEYNHGL